MIRIAIRHDYDQSHGAEMPDYIERVRKQAVPERVIEHECRHQEKPRVMHVLEPIALQRAQIIRVAEFFAKSLEDLPIAFCGRGATLEFKVASVVILSRIVVKQRVINVEEKNNREARDHRRVSLGFR